MIHVQPPREHQPGWRRVLARSGVCAALMAPLTTGAVGIAQIQGAGHYSPMAGERVATEGVVTAVAHNGFYLQDPAGDRQSGGILFNPVDTLTDDNVYTYNFEGNQQVLDHMFVSHNLRLGAGFGIVHVNTDFPRMDEAIGIDHEPIVGRFRIRRNALASR